MGKGAAQKSAIQSFTVNLSVPGKRHNEASVQDFIALHYSPMHHDYPLIINKIFTFCVQGGRFLYCATFKMSGPGTVWYSVVHYSGTVVQYSGTVWCSCQNGHVFHYGSIERN